jgi:predicted esterase
MPYVFSLMCPKPLFISAGEDDPLFPVDSVREAAKIIREVYKKHAPDVPVELEVFKGGHEYSEAFIDWLDEVL